MRTIEAKEITALVREAVHEGKLCPAGEHPTVLCRRRAEREISARQDHLWQDD